MSSLNLNVQGVWTELFKDALVLMAHLETQIQRPHWTFGGGTVLMLRIGHRQSKDIDIFVPDPQYLGYLNPRLSDVAEEISTDYEEHAEFIKFFLAKGEIDIVVSVPLTSEPFEIVSYAGQEVKFETNAEIIAKKMWHRGDQAKARDLFDICAVAEVMPSDIEMAAPFFKRHGAAFLERLDQRMELARREYEAIDTLKPGLTFSQSLELARQIIRPLLD